MDAFGTSEETQALIAEIDRFAARVVAPRVARPEAPLPAEELAAILEAARALGLMPGRDDDGALWSDDGEGALRSVLVLARLARADAGIALALHQASAARRLARALGLDTTGDGVLAAHGRFGIGRDALARWLAGHVAPAQPGDPQTPGPAGAALSEGDRAILADIYAPGSPRLLTTHPGFAWILAPWVDPSGTMQWALHPREALAITPHPHAHGFDDLVTISFRPAAPAAVLTALDPDASRARMAEALAVIALGLVAVAAGAAARGHAIAARYAATRRQGGKLIGEHAAVKLLLASSGGGLAAAEAQLESVARRPLGLMSIARVLALRAEAHPLLCRAANDALQVLGGTGYMRDAGAEKVVREVNHLRAIGGSPPELALFVAEWERLHA